jgi:hypothetical protein
MSFRDYIATRRVTDTPAVDFVRQARKDRHLPDSAASLAPVVEALQALRDVQLINAATIIVELGNWPIVRQLCNPRRPAELRKGLH